jgi:hypothetical protein
MKPLLFLSFYFWQRLDFSQNKTGSYSLNWYTDYDAAVRQAKLTQKPMLVYFGGSDWCAPCAKLEKKFFDTKRFSDESKDYVLVYLDIPQRIDIISPEARKKNKEVAKKLKSKSYPTIIALDHRGKEKNRIERFSGSDPRYHWDFMDKNKRLFKL